MAEPMPHLPWTSLALCAGGLALLLAACASRGELEARHAPSRVEMPSPQADFAAYVAQVKAQIAAANRAIGKELDPQVLEDRAPFELVPEPGRRCARTADGRHQRAALLIHGLGETPYAMRALGERFAAACFLVRAILLPGHGTVPGDLLDVGHADWVEATRAGAQSFAGLAERLYLVGFSSGGTLALDYALGEPQPLAPVLAGLVLLAPVIATRSGQWPLTRDHLAQGALMPAGGFAQLLPDEDPVRYGSLARNAERQLDALIGRVDDRQRRLALPVFMALSAADAVVDPAAARRWFCRQLIGPRDLIWYASGAEPPDDCRFVELRASDHWPGILDLSHPALPIAPDDRRYGAAAGYADCEHYYWETDTPAWLICADPQKTPANSKVRYGEITQQNLAAHVVRRLTYNPDFDALVARTLTFIAASPWPSPPLPEPKPATP
jgi:esterase/lipase